MKQKIEALWHFLPPQAKLVVEKMQLSGFIYKGIEKDFSDNATHHKGWILEIDNTDGYFPWLSFVLVTWEATGDTWCFEIQDDSDLVEDEEEATLLLSNKLESAIANIKQLIDEAEKDHNTSQGQLSLF